MSQESGRNIEMCVPGNTQVRISPGIISGTYNNQSFCDLPECFQITLSSPGQLLPSPHVQSSCIA